jgi:hypothetical protein
MTSSNAAENKYDDRGLLSRKRVFTLLGNKQKNSRKPFPLWFGTTMGLGFPFIHILQVLSVLFVFKFYYSS